MNNDQPPSSSPSAEEVAKEIIGIADIEAAEDCVVAYDEAVEQIEAKLGALLSSRDTKIAGLERDLSSQDGKGIADSGAAQRAMRDIAESRVDDLESKVAELERERDELRAVVEKREHQLRLAVAGMGEGKDPSVFVVLLGGRIADVVQRTSSTAADPFPNIRDLVPLSELAALAAASRTGEKNA